jgi:flagellin
MALTINTNVMSLNAQRNLGQSQSALSKSMQRLSSGLRINSAKDDAAGLAISDRMTAQIRGLNQASRNANDGISLAQTAEGALQETTNLLQRMRELAVQSANDTNSASDRESLQAEVTQLVSEMDRIAQTTAFNGKNVIDGTLSNATFQVGANAGQTISFSIGAASSSDLGQIAKASGGSAVNGTASNGSNITINSTNIVDSSSFVDGNAGKTSDSALALAKAINASGAGVRAEAEATALTVDASGGISADATLSLNGVDIFDGTGTPTTLADVASQINVYSNDTGVTAVVDGTDIELTAADGRNIDITTAGGTTNPFSVATTRGSIQLTSSDNVTLDAGNAILGFAGTVIAKDTNSINGLNITTVAGANEAIERLDSALGSVDTIRGDLGAVQNRFESTIANLQNVAENLSAARSRILDADIAQETSNMTKQNILQQAGVSILAQANQAPQLALSLLG